MTDTKLTKVLEPGMSFRHRYDFGSTTTLDPRVVDAYSGPVGGGRGIKFLARNDPPETACSECGAPAVWICMECGWGGAGWLCEARAEEHPCGPDMYLPVVNSPRGRLWLRRQPADLITACVAGWRAIQSTVSTG